MSWLEKITRLIFRQQTEDSDMTEFSPVWPVQAGLRDTRTVDQAELRLELRSLELSPFFSFLGGPVKGKCFPITDT